MGRFIGGRSTPIVLYDAVTRSSEIGSVTENLPNTLRRSFGSLQLDLEIGDQPGGGEALLDALEQIVVQSLGPQRRTFLLIINTEAGPATPGIRNFVPAERSLPASSVTEIRSSSPSSN